MKFKQHHSTPHTKRAACHRSANNGNKITMTLVNFLPDLSGMTKVMMMHLSECVAPMLVSMYSCCGKIEIHSLLSFCYS